jgi:hypothetical protein
LNLFHQLTKPTPAKQPDIVAYDFRVARPEQREGRGPPRATPFTLFRACHPTDAPAPFPSLFIIIVQGAKRPGKWSAAVS